MTFPLFLQIGALRLHPHPLFEALAYFIGFRVYLWTRTKGAMPVEKGIAVLAGAAIGAAIGSKLLYWFEDPEATLARWHDLAYMLGGKTIVGGLLGGLIGVEWTKKLVGWTRSTGDDFALPLIVGMSIGRIGCFLTGLGDHTYGTPTSWPVGVDFGDGVPRRPAQLYEIVALWLIAAALYAMKRGAVAPLRGAPSGARFQLFMIGYLIFRFAIDFMKPTVHPYAGLNNVQVACLLGLLYYAWVVARWPRRGAAIRPNNETAI
ncbi:prolipoprotein diacylglyceryl transferase [Paenibacillus cymbidii]|uniref:prolipoprotein diacylglyceryl transferase n=1 Tax=Paenibacillus cymbidii TaxID=1639034 RepID=UPI0010802753|nr:prolipoprotein diacylglyceryl transferase family protein [Paenibacillus cymbidii]